MDPNIVSNSKTSLSKTIALHDHSDIQLYLDKLLVILLLHFVKNI